MRKTSTRSESQEVERLREQLNQAYAALADKEALLRISREELRVERAKPKGITDEERINAYKQGDDDARTGKECFTGLFNVFAVGSYRLGYAERSLLKATDEIDRLQHHLAAVTTERDEAKATTERIKNDMANANANADMLTNANKIKYETICRLRKLVSHQAAHIAEYEGAD